MATVTVEGSLTPSNWLATGKRVTVQLTPRIERLIAKGFLLLIATDAAPKKAAQSVADAPYRAGEPAWNALRDEWARFVIAHGQVVVASDTKGDIIHRWQASRGGF
jgi:hypothetical protein